jgi:hypothetical protein
MAYLINKDYSVNIQDANIAQIISADESIRSRAQLAGEAEAKSYLKQKYNLAREFQDLAPFNYSTTYYPFNRVYLDAPAYNVTAAYAANQLALHQGKVYRAIGAINAPAGAFDPSKFALIGGQYDIFNVPAPKP